MKTSLPLIALSLAAACGSALAAEYGNVVSSTAVTAQVAVPQQQCTDQQVLMPPRTSGGGALLGALVGGALGNSMGSGAGRAAATGLGIVAGAAIGDHAEASNSPPAVNTVRTCTTVTSYESRIVGYDVVYEYNGQRYTSRVAQDPGARIALNVTVAPAAGTVAAPQPMPIATVAPPVVYSATPAYGFYGPYAPYGYYDGYYGGPAVAIEPRLVIGGGYRHHGY